MCSSHPCVPSAIDRRASGCFDSDLELSSSRAATHGLAAPEHGECQCTELEFRSILKCEFNIVASARENC